MIISPGDIALALKKPNTQYVTRSAPSIHAPVGSCQDIILSVCWNAVHSGSCASSPAQLHKCLLFLSRRQTSTLSLLVSVYQSSFSDRQCGVVVIDGLQSFVRIKSRLPLPSIACFKWRNQIWFMIALFHDNQPKWFRWNGFQFGADSSQTRTVPSSPIISPKIDV